MVLNRRSRIVLEFWCIRSEEHTSELQSHYSISYAVFCLSAHSKARREEVLRIVKTFLCFNPSSWTEGPGLYLNSGVLIHEGCHPCEHYATASPGAWSCSLTQDLSRWTLVLMVEPYIRLARIEVNLQFGGCSRNWIAATKLFPVMSYSWIFCHETIWITTRLLLAFSINVCVFLQ